MKKLLFLLLLAAASAGAQNANIPTFDTDTLYLESPVYYTNRLDCEPYETFTPWLAKSEGNDGKFIHQHEWVYAEREDVNRNVLGVTLAMHCPCQCSKTENQARICEACFRHEWRTRKYGQRPKEKEKSKYLQILEGVKDSVIIEIGEGAGNGKIKYQEAGGAIYIEIETGKRPKTNGVVLLVKSSHEKMYVSGADGPEGETFKNNQQFFYVSIIAGGFAIMSKGTLPEFTAYSFKIDLR